MKIRIKTNIKFNGERIGAGAVFSDPLPEGMDAEFINDTRVCEVLEAGPAKEAAPKPAPRIIKKASK